MVACFAAFRDVPRVSPEAGRKRGPPALTPWVLPCPPDGGSPRAGQVHPQVPPRRPVVRRRTAFPHPPPHGRPHPHQGPPPPGGARPGGARPAVRGRGRG